VSGKTKKPGDENPDQGSFDLSDAAPAPHKESLAAKAVPPPDDPLPPAEPLRPAEPETPEEAIPALTMPEPSNPEMNNPAPLADIDPPVAVPEKLPEKTAPRLGILRHDAPPQAAPKKRSSKFSAAIVGISVMGSRLMGVIREQVFAYMFGTTMFADAFIAAFRIPNLLRDLFAEGALSTAFTTTFTKTWEKEGNVQAWHLARLVLSTLTLILGVICILSVIFAPQIVYLISGGFEGVEGKFDLTVRMTQLLFPFILFVSLAAAVMGMLNARHIFGIPASASTIFNIVSIISGVVFAVLFSIPANGPFDLHQIHFGEPAIFGWCIGVLMGGLAQLGVQLPSLYKLGFRYKWTLDFKDSALRTVMILMVPSAIAGSAVQVNVMVSGQFASHIPGAMSWLYYAFRLWQLPVGIFGVAIATVTLPAVARQHALDDLKAFGKTVEEALRFGFYLTLPASVGLAVISQPVIQLIYEHGNFTAASTDQTALALQAYTIGLVGYSGIKILVPCFYAMQPPRFEELHGVSFWKSFLHFVRNVVFFTPVRVSLTGIALNLAFCLALYYWLGWGYVGLALTTGLVAVINFLQLVYAIQKKIDLGHAGDWLSFLVRVSVAAFACGCIVLLGDNLLLAHRTTHSLLGAVILFLNIGVAGAVYFGLTVLFRVPESVDLMALIKRKFGKSSATR
jgi:putative peptidoglycan lipid II flippase